MLKGFQRPRARKLGARVSIKICLQIGVHCRENYECLREVAGTFISPIDLR